MMLTAKKRLDSQSKIYTFMNMHATDRAKMFVLIPKKILILENGIGCYYFLCSLF